MSRVYMIADLHFGHRKIMDFAGDYRAGDDYIENMHITIALWNARIMKQDLIYVLGDVAFSPEGLDAINEMKGTKVLIRGNHDQFSLQEYTQVFSDILGIKKYKGYWLSHAPIHPVELRGCQNIHGHVHQNCIRVMGEPDPRYINVSIENTDGAPVLFEDIRHGWVGCDRVNTSQINLEDYIG